MADIGRKPALHRQKLTPPRSICFQRGTDFLPAFLAGLAFCGNLFRRSQTGVSIIKHGQLFPRIPQHGARHLRIHFAGQNTGKWRAIHAGLLQIGAQALAGHASVVGGHTPQIVHKDVGGLVRDRGQVSPLEYAYGGRFSVKIDLGAQVW
ncbi:hypothetical protein [uncultured Desulfovibrio sp.]|uniref:hypothetical protein n=1 Tax=uncultured Desulfovibrio sp. TaxID=167968 RepID=UPI00261D74A3|nr:hypothetical protein [uncultured Desulfovibrio sp.]